MFASRSHIATNIGANIYDGFILSGDGLKPDGAALLAPASSTTEQPTTMGNRPEERQIVEAWSANAEPWIEAVREDRIRSRKLVTDKAIVGAVLSLRPATALDIGCGEGWLTRVLTRNGVETVGVDIVPELVDAARKQDGTFHLLSYEDLAAGKLAATFDVAVCNFSLLGRESVETLVQSTPSFLRPGGSLVVQTLHPIEACGDGPYEDGWREGSWAGIEGSFSDPAPWYFRTLTSWLRLFLDSNLQIVEIREPVHPQTGRPASLILIGQPTL